MGKEGQYDLKLNTDCASSSIISPDTETEDETSLTEMHLNGSSHPTKLLKNASMKMLKTIAVSVGLYGDKIEKSALTNITSMFRMLLASKPNIQNMSLEYWTTLGFLRAIAQPKQMSKLLTTPTWLKLCIEILNSPIIDELDVYKKVHCVRLLHATLVHWDDEHESDRVERFVQQLFECLGKIVLYCPNDLSILQACVDVKARVLVSASHSSTIGEEMILLLRKLHTLPVWNNAINFYLSQKICIAAEFFSESADEANGRQSIIRSLNVESEKAYVLAALVTIGNCDPRPRIGMQILNLNNSNDGTITAFTNKGKAIISNSLLDNSILTEKKKISMSTATLNANIVPFNMSRLPLNEMLLNALTVLIYGPGEWKSELKSNINVNLLRMQQIHLSTLNSLSVLFKHQSSLRKILRQRCPAISRYTSEESICEQEINIDITSTKVEMQIDEKILTPEPNRYAMESNASQTSNYNNNNNQNQHNENDDDESSDDFKMRATNELLLQSLLTRAIQSNPIKSIYSYEELAIAALNLSQQLANALYMDSSLPYYNTTITNNLTKAAKSSSSPLQPTIIHGIPINNDSVS